MSSEYFDFKRFRVRHDRCAMKVGTDGVLLGAWADVEQARAILDIGTGTGLVALMAAQRSPAMVTAVETDEEAVRQARENVARSPFGERIEVVRTDIRDYRGKRFDRVLSNPPFFEETLLPPDPARSAARHTHGNGLSLEELAECASGLLAEGGRFSVILPAKAADRFAHTCGLLDLWPARATRIITRPGKEPKRMLQEFIYKEKIAKPCISSLTLTDTAGNRSQEYSRLTRDFYL